MSDSSGILNALVAKLGSDAPLLALMPNGIYEDEAAPGMQRFVIVSYIPGGQDIGTYGKGRTIEDGLYLVEARTLTTANGNVGAAAARIDALLEDGTLDVPGYVLMEITRQEFVRGPIEVDAVDPSIRWKRRGGRYRVRVALT